MFHKRKTGTAVIYRWKAERNGPRWGAVSRGKVSFAEDLALFERQVRDETGRKDGSATTAA